MRSRWFKNGPIFMAFEFEITGLKGGGTYSADLFDRIRQARGGEGVSIREVAWVFEYRRNRVSKMPRNSAPPGPRARHIILPWTRRACMPALFSAVDRFYRQHPLETGFNFRAKSGKILRLASHLGECRLNNRANAQIGIGLYLRRAKRGKPL